MVKKISMLALAGLIALPAIAAASGSSSAPNDLERKIEELSMQLDQLKAQMAENKGKDNALSDDMADLGDSVSNLEDRSDAWDLAARFNFYGDYRARLDFYNATGASGQDYSNDTVFSNRFRLNMRVKATENIEVKARLAMYKAWGTPTTVRGAGQNGNAQVFPMWDGNSTRNPSDNALRVDRIFANWNNIGGAPIWFSVGRRPTSDGPPSHIRMGSDTRLATPIAFMDWPFDGISMGYAYRWGSEAMGNGRIRFCYGRGFEDGLESDAANLYDDMDFGGLSWDVMKKDNRFMNIQSFLAVNVFSYPDFQDPVINMLATMPRNEGGYGAREQVGNILHTTAIYQDKISDVNFFAAGGWSQTQPDGSGMFNDGAGMIAQGMMAQGVPQQMVPGALAQMGITDPELALHTDNEDGFSIFLGTRYDIDSLGLKVGAEWNYGSKHWISMSPGHDDMYLSKLATRGNVYEVYGIYDIPAGEAISKYAKAFIRLGYQRYEYDYSGSMDWNLRPYEFDNASDLATLTALGMDPIESSDQVYLTFETFF